MAGERTSITPTDVKPAGAQACAVAPRRRGGRLRHDASAGRPRATTAWRAAGGSGCCCAAAASCAAAAAHTPAHPRCGPTFAFAATAAAAPRSAPPPPPLGSRPRPALTFAPLPRAQVLYKNTLDCWVKIFQKEGFGGFFKGALTNAIRGSGGAVVLVMYDEIQKVINPNYVGGSGE